jgi:hypothetical protein
MTSPNPRTDPNALAGPLAALFRVEVTTAVLLRLVQGPGRTWLDLRGLTWLQLPVPEQP